MRSIDRKFYESQTWRDCQAAYMKKANHLCERCLAKGIHEPARIVHHRIHLTQENLGDPELMYGFDNLEALCIECHNTEHRRGRKVQRWKFVYGELVTKGDGNE
jgi:5-methylcytosine-specific restriction endonuclease McrA